MHNKIMFMNIYFYFSIPFLKFFFSFGTFFFSESKKRCITIRFRWGLTELESLRGLVKLTAENIYILLSSLVSFSRETNGSEERKEYLKRRELSRRSCLFEKLRWGVKKIGPATHVLLTRHFARFQFYWINQWEGKGFKKISY